MSLKPVAGDGFAKGELLFPAVRVCADDACGVHAPGDELLEIRADRRAAAYHQDRTTGPPIKKLVYERAHAATRANVGAARRTSRTGVYRPAWAIPAAIASLIEVGVFTPPPAG